MKRERLSVIFPPEYCFISFDQLTRVVSNNITNSVRQITRARYNFQDVRFVMLRIRAIVQRMLFFVVSKENYGVCVLHFDNIISIGGSVQVICIIFVSMTESGK